MTTSSTPAVESGSSDGSARIERSVTREPPIAAELAALGELPTLPIDANSTSRHCPRWQVFSRGVLLTWSRQSSVVER